ncbi:unnamed protein product [Ceutorhynchus assimilis]|uniref:Programmed cell death protein 7 n=1 Tax=Ceutorhynchus assimilis TaxID=467358 RepID=A0A9N9MQ84_9CUCU|nr:unnamed protein product [Ceutorhynchus assimilis]
MMNFSQYHQPLSHNPTSSSRQASEVAAQIFLKQNLEKTNVLDNIYNKSNDELWIETWLQQNNIHRPLPKLRKVYVPQDAMTIRQAKLLLNKCLMMLQKLKKLQQSLEKELSTMSEAEWKKKTLEITTLKTEFTKIMFKFNKADVMKYLNITIRTRRKRRLNDQKRRSKKILVKQENEEKRIKAHKDIDQWLANKKEEVEKVKMEEEMQKDADLVLSEVTKKRNDARKQLSLISALVKLRTVREQMANQRGEKLNLEDKRAFSITTEKLVKMWENTTVVYLKEEQGLRLMLEKNQIEDTRQAKLAKERRLVEEWKTVLFSPLHAIPSNYPTFWALTAAERDIGTFVAIRRSWDTFLVPQHAEEGAKIPIGWILPKSQNTLDSWNQYLDRSTLPL